MRGGIARAVTFDSRNPGVYYYPDRKWQAVPEGMTYTFMQDGTPQIDARNNVYYMAAGNSPAMMAKNVGQGSQYLWTYRDADGVVTRVHLNGVSVTPLLPLLGGQEQPTVDRIYSIQRIRQ